MHFQIFLNLFRRCISGLLYVWILYEFFMWVSYFNASVMAENNLGWIRHNCVSKTALVQRERVVTRTTGLRVDDNLFDGLQHRCPPFTNASFFHLHINFYCKINYIFILINNYHFLFSYHHWEIIINVNSFIPLQVYIHYFSVEISLISLWS